MRPRRQSILVRPSPARSQFYYRSTIYGLRLTSGPGPIPAYKMALAGSIAGGVAGVIGNPAELMMVRMQADKAKPPARKCNNLGSASLFFLAYHNRAQFQSDTTTETRFKV